MTILQFFKSIIGTIWYQMSLIQVPLLNIPVTSFLLGAFIVAVSIGILNPLLGIGGLVVDSFVSGSRRSRSSVKASASARERSFFRNRAEADRKLLDVSRWV